MKISIKDTSINGVKIINYNNFKDKRGTIWTTYLKDYFDKHNLYNFKHDKFSVSNKDVIRGIHYDSHTAKLVTAVYGSIQQVVVDMRVDSPTYKQYLSFDINKNNRYSILIPPMVGNGFRVKSESAVYHYKLAYLGKYFDYSDQFTYPWNDKNLNIDWPSDKPIISSRDNITQ